MREDPVIVVGAGWFGLHIAFELKRAGIPTVVLERNPGILLGTSGCFGIRLHRGPHYPRSSETRKHCANTFHQFREAYPSLVVDHDLAIYANGMSDSLGLPSKVPDELFASVCNETDGCITVDTREMNLTNIGVAFNLPEPSIVVREALRSFFREEIQKFDLQVHLNTQVVAIRATSAQSAEVSCVSPTSISASRTIPARRVVDATSFGMLDQHALADMGASLGVQVVFQACVGVLYRKKVPTARPLSFIVMDGWFPCLMPVLTEEAQDGEDDKRLFHDYVLTHGSHTILGSFVDATAAHAALSEMNTSEEVRRRVVSSSEREMCRFWPSFADEFEYQGWKGAVLPKPRTRRECRASFVVEKDHVMHVFPGKISNVITAADEVMKMLEEDGCESAVGPCNGWRYLRHGAFAQALGELTEHPRADEQCTCNL